MRRRVLLLLLVPLLAAGGWIWWTMPPAVAIAMAANGFANENLERSGFGFDRPIANNETPEGRAKNRRVAVIVPFE